MTIRHWNERVDLLSLQLGYVVTQTHPQFMDHVKDMMNRQDALRRSQDAEARDEEATHFRVAKAATGASGSTTAIAPPHQNDSDDPRPRDLHHRLSYGRLSRRSKSYA